MSQDYGMPMPSHRRSGAHPKPRPARYMIVIDSAGTALARLFLDTREQVAEFDASAEEVVSMSDGLQAAKTATDSAWDRALGAHTTAERQAADVYTLEI